MQGDAEEMYSRHFEMLMIVVENYSRQCEILKSEKIVVDSVKCKIAGENYSQQDEMLKIVGEI